MSNSKSRQLYTREFKVEAVRLVTERGYKAAEAAKNLGISPGALSKWKRELEAEGAPEAAFPGKGYLKPAEAQLRDLKQELDRVTRERDILKKAVAYFAAPLK
jgi:transposase